jgi:hemerythrin-like domain-containing protein
MLHAIGRKQRNSGDLVDMLVDCHVRIRTFSALAVAVSERADTPVVEVADVCTRVERYFADALPLHVRDEEESVLPRLRGRSPAVDAALARMHEQHEMHVDLLGRLLVSSAALRARPGDPDARSALHAVAHPLQSVFEPHLQAEEEIIFPAIRTLLSAEDQQAIIGELRARRATKP